MSASVRRVSRRVKSIRVSSRHKNPEEGHPTRSGLLFGAVSSKHREAMRMATSWLCLRLLRRLGAGVNRSSCGRGIPWGIRLRYGGSYG